jgi:hypothetical protein
MSTLTAESILRLVEQLPSAERIQLNQLLARRQAESAKANSMKNSSSRGQSRSNPNAQKSQNLS